MRRLHVVWLVVLVPFFVVCVALSGCKRVDSDENDPSDLPGASGRATAVKLPTPIKMGTGIIKGKVIWKAAKPPLATLDTEMLAKMGAKPTDVPVCLSKECTKDEKSQQEYRIGDNNGVGNVVVWLTPPSSNYYFAFEDEDLKKLKAELGEVKEIGQPHCTFIPHVQWVFTHCLDPDAENPRKLKETGQVLKVTNRSTTAHNTKWEDTGKIRGKNAQIPPNGEPLTLPLVPETRPLQIQCNIHPWMDAWIWDLNHPYADITKYSEEKPEEYGTFVIRNVPLGVKLKIGGWHEKAGFLKPVGSDDIELKSDKPLNEDVVFEIVK